MELVAQLREVLGKKVKNLRQQGLIPAELYGHNAQNIHLAISLKNFTKVFKEAGTSAIVNLLVGKEKYPVLIYDYQKDYLTGDFIHVDFYEVRMDEKIQAKVPLEFIGEPPAVKEKGGILNKSMFEIEVEALPTNLPSHLTVNLNYLTDLDQSIYVKDLEVPPGVEILIDPETVIATITREEKEEKEGAPIDISAIKVEDEEKRTQREINRGNE